MDTINGSNKRKDMEFEETPNNPYEHATYSEYVSKDNELLRKKMRQISDEYDKCKKYKERLEERLKEEIELRLKEKRIAEANSRTINTQMEKMKKEKAFMEHAIRLRDTELKKMKSMLCETVTVDDIVCDKCDFKTRSEVSLILHNINHKLAHPNQRRLILHPNMFSPKNPNSTYLYMCPICEGTALTRNEIYPHIYQFHTKEKAYKCVDCDIFFTHIDYLKSHHRHEHDKRTHERNRSKMDFPKEPLITSIYKPVLSRGTQTVLIATIGGSISGGNESITSASITSSISYSPQFTSDEQMKCSFPHCMFTTNNRQKLEFHISAHTNSKYKCPYCAYVGNILTDIYRHVKKSTKHEGKKVFQCIKCDFAIDCERSFRDHLRANHYGDETPEKKIDLIIENIFLNKPQTEGNANANGEASNQPAK